MKLSYRLLKGELSTIDEKHLLTYLKELLESND